MVGFSNQSWAKNRRGYTAAVLVESQVLECLFICSLVKLHHDYRFQGLLIGYSDIQQKFTALHYMYIISYVMIIIF